MKFTVFIKTGERHFDHDGYDDYDGDEGYDTDIEISNEELNSDIGEMIYETYIRDGLLMDKVPAEVKEQLIARIKKFID